MTRHLTLKLLIALSGCTLLQSPIVLAMSSEPTAILDPSAPIQIVAPIRTAEELFIERITLSDRARHKRMLAEDSIKALSRTLESIETNARCWTLENAQRIYWQQDMIGRFATEVRSLMAQADAASETVDQIRNNFFGRAETIGKKAQVASLFIRLQHLLPFVEGNPQEWTYAMCEQLSHGANHITALAKNLFFQNNFTVNLHSLCKRARAVSCFIWLRNMVNRVEEDGTAWTLENRDNLKSAERELRSLMATQNPGQNKQFSHCIGLVCQKAHKLCSTIVSVHHPAQLILDKLLQYVALRRANVDETQRRHIVEDLAELNTLFNEKVRNDAQIDTWIKKKLISHLTTLHTQFTRN